MRKVYVILMAVLLIVGLSAVVAAAGPTTTNTEPAKQAVMRCMGEVTAVDAAAKTFSVKEGEKTMTFMWNQDTKLTEAHHPVTESSLIPGCHVAVHYTEVGGHHMAQHIAVHPAQSATAPSTAPTTTTHPSTK
jgi:hypothetical protein